MAEILVGSMEKQEKFGMNFAVKTLGIPDFGNILAPQRLCAQARALESTWSKQSRIVMASLFG